MGPPGGPCPLSPEDFGSLWVCALFFFFFFFFFFFIAGNALQPHKNDGDYWHTRGPTDRYQTLFHFPSTKFPEKNVARLALVYSSFFSSSSAFSSQAVNSLTVTPPPC